MIDCDFVDVGCNGGLLYIVFEVIIKMGGVQLESDYLYEVDNNNCCMNFNKFLV